MITTRLNNKNTIYIKDTTIPNTTRRYLVARSPGTLEQRSCAGLKTADAHQTNRHRT